MPTLMENIPPQLQELQRWVCANNGSKVPMRTFEGKAASVSKPDTWGDFEEACECIEGGVYEYAGFVFADDGYIGIDIDHAFDETGLLKDEALEAIQACRSYTEVSKSGKGIHIICRGTLPFRGRNNRKGWEIYREARYFLLTGQVAMFGEISDAQEGIDFVVSEHFADDPAESAGSGRRCKIWQPEWRFPKDGRVMVEPEREPVAKGGRHLAMVSFCGQLHSCLAHKETILKRALEANERYMNPPLPEDEIRSIVNSVARYRR